MIKIEFKKEGIGLTSLQEGQFETKCVSLMLLIWKDGNSTKNEARDLRLVLLKWLMYAMVSVESKALSFCISIQLNIALIAFYTQLMSNIGVISLKKWELGQKFS